MEKTGQVFVTIFGAIIGLAILSVIIGRNSQAPQVLQGISSALSNVVHSAVTPIAMPPQSGNLGNNTFSSPSIGAQDFLGGFLNSNPFSSFLK